MKYENSTPRHQKGINNEVLKWLERTANQLDAKYKIPGTRFKFGIDPIIGIIPGIGDREIFLKDLVESFIFSVFRGCFQLEELPKRL